MKRKLEPLRSIEEIPEHMSEDEAADFYASHSLGLVMDQMEPVEEPVGIGTLPPMRRVSFTAREEMLRRLKKVAQARGIPMRILVWLWIRECLERAEAALDR